MIHPTPTKTLLTTTFEPLVMRLSGLLARGPRLLDRFGHAEPTPETTMAFERELSDLLREVGRRIMAWTLNRLEPDADSEAPSRVLCEGHLYRGFDHGAGHPLLLLCNAKAPNYSKNKAFNDLAHYSEGPKVAGAVIKAGIVTPAPPLL